MRWRFYDPRNPVEAAEHRVVSERIHEWWRAFEAKTSDMDQLFRRGGPEWDLPAWMNSHLHPINPHLMWEFGPAITGKGHRLVITPESKQELRPIIDSILEAAPRIPGWEFYSVRLPEPVEHAIQTVQLRAGVDITDATVLVSRGQHNQIDLVFHLKTPAIPEDEDNACFVASEALLGEEILDHWIGNIDGRPQIHSSTDKTGKPRPDPRYISLARLKPTVDALISSTLEQLPKSPLYIHEKRPLPTGGELQTTLFKCEPESAPDYANRDDILFAISTEVDRFRALQQCPSFYSGRFSRRNELFCYLKIDWGDLPMKERFENRLKLEDSIDKILVAAKTACVIGAATGLRYAYVDLALDHLETAIELLVRALRAAEVPHRTWLLFFDVTLKQEWVGIYNDTPPPPGFDAG